jgi:hypothetical protein
LDDLGATAFFTSEFAEGRDDGGQQLDDDSGADVGHDAKRADGAVLEGATGEEAVHAEQPGSTARLTGEEIRQGASIQTGNPDDGFEPADGENHQREQNPRLELGDFEAVAECIGNGGEHVLLLLCRLGFFGCDQLTGAAFGFNFLPGGGAESMSADGKFAGEVAVAEDFDAIDAAVGEAGVAQNGFINAGAVLEPVQGVEVDREITGGMAGVVEAALGNTADERHLAAFEPDPDGAAGACGLAFATAAAGFAVAAGFALAQPFAAVPGARTGFQIV